MSGERVPWFPRDYESSRREFLAVSQQLGGELESHAIDSLGPSGEALTIDLCSFGDRQANRCLVLTSGLHGLEAPLGAAIQLGWMQGRLRQGMPPGVRSVVVHSLNPFGFAWRRRGDAENIDLNRAFMRRGEVRHGAPPLYGKLNSLLNPESPPGGGDFFFIRAVATLARYGMNPVKQAIAGGQYEYPRGLFYGGKGPSETERLLTPHWKSWLGVSQQVIHLDVHTGLGRWGEMCLLSAAQLDSPWQSQCDQAFGGVSRRREPKKTVGYEARGDFGLWCAQQAGAIDYSYFCAEFGTYSSVRVIQALRAENQAHHWGDRNRPECHMAKRNAVEAFCPQARTWRTKSVATGLALCDAAIAQLQK